MQSPEALQRQMNQPSKIADAANTPSTNHFWKFRRCLYHPRWCERDPPDVGEQRLQIELLFTHNAAIPSVTASQIRSFPLSHTRAASRRFRRRRQ